VCDARAAHDGRKDFHLFISMRKSWERSVIARGVFLQNEVACVCLVIVGALFPIASLDFSYGGVSAA
jgi:hypothetical protein